MKQTVQTICDQIEKFAPPNLAIFDYVGLLHGDKNQSVKKVGITLDYSHSAIEQAIQKGCQLLITHHGPTSIAYPLTGNNLNKIATAHAGGLAVYRCHLNLDFCKGGIIDTLCEVVGIPAIKQHTRYEGHQLYGGVNFIERQYTYDQLITHLKKVGSSHIRVAGPHKNIVTRVAITSGQGFIGEFFDQLRPDVYIAGEFEQEAMKYGEDLGIMLIELGHHYSETIPLRRIAKRLQKNIGVPIIPIEVDDTVRVIAQKGALC